LKKNSVPILAAALSLAWLVSGSPANAAAKAEAVSTDVSEAITANTVKAKLIDKLGADAFHVDVAVSGETATLTGQVAKATSQDLAKQIALSVDGIKKVDDKTTVANPPGFVAASEATVNNMALELKVRSVLLTEIGTNAFKITIDANDGVVSLRGKLESDATTKAAIQKTRSIKGVKKVVDLLG
jgi:osmotically-inducible protein OsmY